MLLFNFGHYEFWETYNPPGGAYGPQNCTFDGPNKLILINEGVTYIDVQEDIYSGWKEWIMPSDHQNAGFLQALTAIGGDPITDTQSVGITYFLENGWRLQPWETDVGYVLTIDGNLYTREPGGAPANPVSSVTVNFVRSNLVDIVDVSDGITVSDVTLANSEYSNIANNVWEEVIDVPKGQIARDKMRKIATKTQDIALE